ncbi:MAG: Fe-S-containing hydro-lyase [Oscillospiraceae bacterium]|nr:Fe-S-containing hydro-lyase [Oscillospiraceae bacterium]
MLKNIRTPLLKGDIVDLHAGDKVSLSGIIYTGRDAAHRRLVELLEQMEPLPFDIRGQVIYYAGPCPAKPGKVIGPVGPTTSGRMDAYAPRLIQEGLGVMIGKGGRSDDVIDAIKQHTGLYLAAIGGAAAVMAKCVVKSEIVAFEDLGTEAIRVLTVENMPLYVAIDCRGRSIYER